MKLLIEQLVINHLRIWKDQMRTCSVTCEKCGKTNLDEHDRERLYFLYRLIEKADEENQDGEA